MSDNGRISSESSESSSVNAPPIPPKPQFDRYGFKRDRLFIFLDNKIYNI